MRIGSLFSGIGGLELGLEWAGVGETVWQVEWDPWCRSILAKHWPRAERFDDVRTVGAHNLEPVDVICGGYPCQPFSTAGSRNGAEDPRHLWPEFARIVRELGPRFAVLENVAGHLSLGFGDVLRDLAEMGYDARWFVLRASDVGAPHRRERLFCIARRERLGNAERERWDCRSNHSWHGTPREGTAEPCRVCGSIDVADPERLASERRRRSIRMAGEAAGMEAHCERGQPSGGAARDCGEAVADGDGLRLEGRKCIGPKCGERAFASDARDVADGDERRCKGKWESQPRREQNSRGYELDGCDTRRASQEGREHWSSESRMGREPNGLPGRMDRWPAGPNEPQHEWEAPRVAQGVPNRTARLKALGNAVVPQVAEVVGHILLEIDRAAR